MFWRNLTLQMEQRFVKQNAATPFLCDTPEILCGLRNFPWLSVSIGVITRRWWLTWCKNVHQLNPVAPRLLCQLDVMEWERTGLQHRLEISSHADLLLLLADEFLDGGREAAGVTWEDQRVAVLAAPVVLHAAAGVGEGVVVIVGVNDPVVVTWQSQEEEVSLDCVEMICVYVCVCVYTWAGSPPLDR